MSDTINDPVSVFYHADVKCESITERNWQRLNVDRVVSSQFNAAGTLCAMYISYNSIEIWDFSSIPMPITSLGIPRHLTGRMEGQCFALTWSPCSKQIIGIFGNKSNAKRHSVPLSVETNRYSYICVWDIESRRVTHKYRLPFVANTINPISSTNEKSSLYMLSSAHGNCLFLMDIESGKIVSACTGSGILPINEDMTKWVLYDSVNELTAVAMAVVDSMGDESVFTVWCDLHCNSSNSSSSKTVSSTTATTDNSTETASFSSPLCFVHTPIHGTVLYRAVYDTTDTTNTVSLVALSVMEQAFTEVSRTVLQSNTRIVSIEYDTSVNLLLLATESMCIQVYSVLQDSLHLQHIATHQPTDRHLVDILNAHTTGINMRSANKYTTSSSNSSTGNQKKNYLAAIPFAVNSAFKCISAGFYFHQKEKITNSTRYSNSLTPHYEIPLYNQQTSRELMRNDYTNTIAATTKELSENLSTSPPTDFVKLEQSTTAIVRTLPEVQCSVLYRVQSTPTQSSLVLWDLDDATLLGSGKNASSAVKDCIKPIPLPFSEVTQVNVAPYCSSTSTSSSRLSDQGKRRTSMRPPGQAVVCLDVQGGAWVLRPQYRSDFPGPMYPVGYTLVTQVIEYMESESELDKIVVDLTQSSSRLGSREGAVSAPGHASSSTQISTATGSSNTLGGAVSKSSTNRTAGMSYSSTSSSGSLASPMSSGHSSMESLLGLDLLEQTDSPNKRVKLEHPLTSTGACYVSSAVADDTTMAMEVDRPVSEVDVAKLVSSRDDAYTLQHRVVLPFTFADDYLRFSASVSSTVKAVATTVESIGSPSQSQTHCDGVQQGDRLTGAALSPIFSPSRDHNHCEDDNSHDTKDHEEDDEISTTAGNTSSNVNIPAFSGGFDEYFPIPARVQTGAFEVKLREHQYAAQNLRQLLTQPGRVIEKLLELQEQAAQSVIHAEEVKERSRQRNAMKKLQKENEKAALAAAAAEIARQEKLQKILSDQQLLVTMAGVTVEEAEWMRPASGEQITWVMQILTRLQSGEVMEEHVQARLRMILDASKRTVTEQGQASQQQQQPPPTMGLHHSTQHQTQTQQQHPHTKTQQQHPHTQIQSQQHPPHTQTQQQHPHTQTQQQHPHTQTQQQHPDTQIQSQQHPHTQTQQQHNAQTQQQHNAQTQQQHHAQTQQQHQTEIRQQHPDTQIQPQQQ